MAFTPDLSRIVIQLNKLDPQIHSVNENYDEMPKRTLCQWFLGRLIYFLSFGWWPKNPELDRTTRKIIHCAETWLHSVTQIEPKLQSRLVQAFTILQKIDEYNDGAEGQKILEVITAIKGLKLEETIIPKQPDTVPPPAAASVPLPQEPQSPAQPSIEPELPETLILDLKRKAGPEIKYGSIFTHLYKLEQAANGQPLPQLKQFGRLVVDVLKEFQHIYLVGSPTFNRHFLRVLSHADAIWYQETLPDLPVTALEFLLRACFVVPKGTPEAYQVLDRICCQMEQLPSNHLLFKRLAAFFPDNDKLPAKCQSDYENARAMTLGEGEQALVAYHTRHFLSSGNFQKVFDHFEEAGKGPFLEKVFGLCASYCRKDEKENIAPWSSLLAFADQWEGAYAIHILSGLACTLEGEYLAQVCLSEKADDKLIWAIVRGSYRQFDLPIPVFRLWIQTICQTESPHRQGVLKRVIKDLSAEQFSETMRILTKEYPALFAPLFDITNRTHSLEKIPPDQALAIAQEIIKQNENVRPKLFQLVKLTEENSILELAAASGNQALLCVLFEYCQEENRIKFITKTMQESTRCDMLSKLSVKGEEWLRAGKSLCLDKAYSPERLESLVKTLPLRVDLIQGMAENDTLDEGLKASLIGPLFVRMVVRANEEKKAAKPSAFSFHFFSYLSDSILRYVDAKTIDAIPSQALKDAIQASSYLSSDKQKQLLFQLTRRLFAEAKSPFDPGEMGLGLRILTKSQMQQLPWGNYAPLLALLFAARVELESEEAQKELQRIALVSLTEDEQKTFPALAKRMGINVSLAFVQKLCLAQEVPPALLQALLDHLLDNGQLGDRELNDLPDAIFCRLPYSEKVMKSILRAPTLIRFLRQLSPEATRLALDSKFYLCQNDLTGDFPFAKVIQEVESPKILFNLILNTLGTVGFDTKLEQMIQGKHPLSSSLPEIFSGLEKAPWKLWIVLEQARQTSYLDVAVLKKWEEGRQKYPRTFEVIDQFEALSSLPKWPKQDQRWKTNYFLMFKFLLNTHVNHQQWSLAYEVLNKAHADAKRCLLASIENASPEGLNKYYEQHIGDDSGKLFAAIFDASAQTALSTVSDSKLTSFKTMLEQLSQAELPPEVLAIINETRSKIFPAIA